jgi:hypothetical protein
MELNPIVKGARMAGMDDLTALKFFEHAVVQYPLERDNDDFEAFVDARLQAYVNLIRGMTPADNITKLIRDSLDQIETLCHSIKEAIQEYLRGLPHRAYAKLNEGIGVIRNEFRLLSEGTVNDPFIDKLYRIRRESEPGTTFPKGQLFHIPFDQRHKVARQRYSIPGLPCLYLGGSLYICWEELGRPSFESIHVARFRRAPGEEIRVLDFTQRPQHLANRIRLNPSMENDFPMSNLYRSLAVVWPLMAAASIRRKHGSSPFIAEYIIPQLILQWITENNDPDLDGIGYSSVSCKAHVDDPRLIVNLVFPAKQQFLGKPYTWRLRGAPAATHR